MLIVFHDVYLSQQCADAHHGKLQTAARRRFVFFGGRNCHHARLRPDPRPYLYVFLGKIKDCFFTNNNNGTATLDPSQGTVVTVQVRHSASLLRPELLTSKHTHSLRGISFSQQPYMQAEFAGVFLYSVFESLSLCLYFFRAHSAIESGYSSV
jgi:hypothetical protein